MIRINGTGCVLLDIFYNNIDFSSQYFSLAISQKEGDGGLTIGGLVFLESLSLYTGKSAEEIMKILTEGKDPVGLGLGGPGIVAMVHAMQMNNNSDIRYRFSGLVGKDDTGVQLKLLLKKIDFPLSDWQKSDYPSPRTLVLSDPLYDKGRGERSFVTEMGALKHFDESSLPLDFFDAEILYFGATALLPALHSQLDELTERGHRNGSFILVGTVYDFPNEERSPKKPWPLVKNYENIDLLICDREEALKISRQSNPEDALMFFLEKGCGGVIITQGIDDVLLGVGNHSRFKSIDFKRMPTCRYADQIVSKLESSHDTTGCGDNFVGGALHSVTSQFQNKGLEAKIELVEIVIEGIAAGSLALGQVGGVNFSLALNRGEKERYVAHFRDAYRKELNR